MQKLEIMKDEKCPVCCDEFCSKTEQTVVIEMPCGHHFCEECLLGWLESHHNCPTCRQEIEGKPKIPEQTFEQPQQ